MAEAASIAPDTPANAAYSQKNLGQKIRDYAKSRFDSDNWFGSLVTAALAYVNYEGVLSARTRIVNGVQSRDRRREISSQIQIGEKAWSFLSERGGEFPEGRTLGQRMMRALRHPQRSSVQFEWLLLLPVVILNNLNHINLGLKAHGIGLKEGEIAYTPEKIRLYSGAYQLLAQALKGYGHFRGRTNVTTAEETNITNSVPNSDGVFSTQLITPIKKIWKHDRIFLIGNILNMFSPVFGGIESWQKKVGSREEAKHLARQTAVTSLIVAAEGVYGAQRIAESNYIRRHQPVADGYAARAVQKYPAASHQERLTSLRQAWKESQEQQL